VAPHVHRGLASLDDVVHELLRLGTYQLLYMASVPDYAAVSETVDHAREAVGGGAARLVNAVLRKVAREGDEDARFPSERDDPATFLATWGSHPRWLVDRWLGRWNISEVRALVEADNRRPVLTLRPLGVEPETAVDILGAAGIVGDVVGGGTGCVRLAGGTSPGKALAALPCAVIQDPAASLVTHYAAIPPGTKVADLCSAPGGKVLAATHRSAYTLASDRSESRIRMVRENARRTGRPLGLVVADARQPPITSADAVLLDVPCTGTGTLSRNPDIRWRLDESTIEGMAALQDQMLDAAAHVVSHDGLLVYSTCSLEPEENEERVHRFLEAHSEFGVDAAGGVPGKYVDSEGLFMSLPQRDGFDGAFAARLRKAG
jgi:16S rRNA (cytosine967-C5)-methyltransferase